MKWQVARVGRGPPYTHISKESIIGQMVDGIGYLLVFPIDQNERIRELGCSTTLINLH